MSAVFGGFQAGAFEYDFQTSSVITDIGPPVITFLPASSQSQINELSDYYCSISYFDVFGNIVVPSAATWKIYDDTNKVTLQPWTAYTPAGPIDTMHIPAAMNAIGNTANLVEIREVTFKITSTGGNVVYQQGVYKVIALDDVP